MKIKFMTPLEYIARQQELMDIHMDAQKLIDDPEDDSTEWC